MISLSLAQVCVQGLRLIHPADPDIPCVCLQHPKPHAAKTRLLLSLPPAPIRVPGAQAGPGD